MDKKEDIKRAIELMENETPKEYGYKVQRFVEKYNWDDSVDDFERILEKLI